MNLAAAFGVVNMFFRAIVYSMETEMTYRTTQTVIMNCNLTKSYDSVSWFLESTKIAIYSENTTKTKGRRVVVGNNGHGEYFLKLVNTTRSDEGLYSCVPDTPHMLDVHHFKLKYVAQPECYEPNVAYKQGYLFLNVSVDIYNPNDSLKVTLIDDESCDMHKDNVLDIYISPSDIARPFGDKTILLQGNIVQITIDPTDFLNSSVLCFNASNNFESAICRIIVPINGLTDGIYQTTTDKSQYLTLSNENIHSLLSGLTEVVMLVLFSISVILNMIFVCKLFSRLIHCISNHQRSEHLSHEGSSHETDITRHDYETINESDVTNNTTQFAFELQNTGATGKTSDILNGIQRNTNIIVRQRIHSNSSIQLVSLDSSISSDGPGVVLNNESVYLNPYVPLRINEMEYLNVYCGILETDITNADTSTDAFETRGNEPCDELENVTTDMSVD